MRCDYNWFYLTLFSFGDCFSCHLFSETVFFYEVWNGYILSLQSEDDYIYLDQIRRLLLHSLRSLRISDFFFMFKIGCIAIMICAREGRDDLAKFRADIIARTWSCFRSEKTSIHNKHEGMKLTRNVELRLYTLKLNYIYDDLKNVHIYSFSSFLNLDKRREKLDA